MFTVTYKMSKLRVLCNIYFIFIHNKTFPLSKRRIYSSAHGDSPTELDKCSLVQSGMKPRNF